MKMVGRTSKTRKADGDQMSYQFILLRDGNADHKGKELT